MIITIARKCGCDADTIGRAVAEKYHLHFMDREAIAAGAKEAGCYDEYEEFYSERPVNSLLYSIVMETEEDNVLHDTPAMALTFIDRLPLEDGCEGYVIQGRCANFAFQGRDDVVSVFLTANDAFCVDTVADTHGVSVRKAKTVVRETNDNRKTYHKYYTGQEWGQAENYDLCLNVAKLGVDGVIAMIDSFIQNRKQAGVKRVVFASSCCVYGSSSKPCRESAPKHPGSPYALSKQIGEELCRFYTQTYGLETVCLCYFNVYGAGQNPNGAYAAVIAQFLQCALKGQPVRIDGTGRQSRDFIAVEDVARANILAAQKGVPGETYNVACGKSYSLLALLRLIEQTTHQKLARTFAPSRAGDVRTSSADISKISRLGFKPRIMLQTGIARLWHTLQQ